VSSAHEPDTWERGGSAAFRPGGRSFGRRSKLWLTRAGSVDQDDADGDRIDPVPEFCQIRNEGHVAGKRRCVPEMDSTMTVDYSELRTKMVDSQVRTTDVTDLRIISAMLEIPREDFVDPARRELAYIDEDIRALGQNAESGPRYLMEPSPFAKLVQLAEVRPQDVVLDVGCASGYSAAVFSKLAESVVALESDAGLAATARNLLATLGCNNVAVVEGPLERGHAAEGPYDVIFVGGAVEEVPDALFGQLREKGRLVAVLGHGNAGVAYLYVKTNGVVGRVRGFNAAVKPLPGFRREATFVF
jgi:protein-L-isoaspartate(D-aspartate) O-methyltransferase